MKLKRLSNITLTLTGQVDGVTRTLSGKVKDVILDSDFDYHNLDRIIPHSTTHTLTFTIDEDTGYAYSIKRGGVKVERRAFIAATDRTAAAIEMARVRVGAPDNAKFRLPDARRLDSELVIENMSKPSPVGVEFYWNETVYV